MEKIIKILGFSNAEKKDKSGTYPCFEVLFEGQSKKIGVFEDDVVASLKKVLDRWVKVEMLQRPGNGYWNITKFIAEAKPEEIPCSADSGLPVASHLEHTANQPSDIKPQALVPSEVIARVAHSIEDNRPVFKMEVGNAGCRVTAKGKTVEECRENAEVLLNSARAMMARADSDTQA